jgi:hypothetical protein
MGEYWPGGRGGVGPGRSMGSQVREELSQGGLRVSTGLVGAGDGLAGNLGDGGRMAGQAGRAVARSGTKQGGARAGGGLVVGPSCCGRVVR